MSGYLDKLRDHEFDGIQEFDNYLPRWWLWSFYLACIFSAIYWLYYHGSSFGMSAAERYQEANAKVMAKMAAEQPITREFLLDYAKQPSAVAAGKKTFETICWVCHKKDGGGLAGPNLTDKFWINGGRIEQIYKTVNEGSPNDPTMVAWGKTMKREKILQVVSYVMTFRNKNVPGGKAPQGKPEDD